MLNTEQIISSQDSNESTKDNVSIVAKTACTGCGACYNACPKNAISMQENEEGFNYPVINEEICIDCGICVRNCAALHPSYNNKAEPDCYAVIADNDIRQKSASGGAFGVLAGHILDKGGSVCGVGWNSDHGVEHMIISSRADLRKLQGVKYIQSNTKKTFSQIKKILQENKCVLFVGTPCQVAGLKLYLKKDYEKLYTVDLVCHGAPSPGIWRKYLNETFGNSKINEICFRNKVFGWGQSLVVHAEDYTYVNFPPIDVFYETFFILMNTRKCCGTCQFAAMPRQGDLTIADAWECDADMNDRKGTSEVLLNNEKGERLFNEIKSQFKKVKRFDLLQAKRGNRALTKPFVEHPARDRFFRLNKTKSVKDSYKYAVKELYDIALLGIWFFPNYGCVLTTYALIQTLKALGKEVLLIDNSRTHAFSSARCAFNQREFLQKHVDISKPYITKNELEKLNDQVDTFIVGSDQLFTQSLIKEVNGYTFFLDFANDEKRKIAYATSMGMGFFFYPAEYRKVKSLLQRFDAISLRENVYKRVVENQFEMPFDCCIDPVFLCAKDEYDKLADGVQMPHCAPLSAYILDCTEGFAGLCKHVAKEFNCGMNIIPDAATDAVGHIQKFFSQKIDKTIRIEQWLHYFKYSEYIITDSFHGLCFSIINRKPFALILNKGRAVSRFKSLLAMLNLEYRSFEKDTITQNYSQVVDVLRTPVDYDRVYQILTQEINRSYHWLKTALVK